MFTERRTESANGKEEVAAGNEILEEKEEDHEVALKKEKGRNCVNVHDLEAEIEIVIKSVQRKNLRHSKMI